MNNSTQSKFYQVTPRILSAVIGVVAGTTLSHAETAYEALQKVGDKLGEESLERVVSVQGNNTGWTVSLLDPNSTEQIQEVRVRKSRVVSKTTEPSAGRLLTPIDLDRLKLDSDAAWKLATRHLQKTVPASRVDYTLATDVNRSMPVWVLKLRNPAVAPICQKRPALSMFQPRPWFAPLLSSWVSCVRRMGGRSGRCPPLAASSSASTNAS